MLVAVRFACGQLGKPYEWGGNGNPGFDCSGLTAAAYAAAGITLPRTAQTQYQAGPLLARGTAVAPGDLIFFGVPGNVHHVAISLGGTAIVHAPDFGQLVKVVLAVSRPTELLKGSRAVPGAYSAAPALHSPAQVVEPLKRSMPSDSYSETTPNTSVTCRSIQRSFQQGSEHFSSAPLAAVRFACAQLGRPYIWGGNGEGGFDCSGLTKAAYAAAGIAIPRTADQQFRAGPRLAPDEPMRPGDLVFYGDPSTRITHVALYIGGNEVVQARDVGTLIEQDALPRAGYAGASRPAAQNGGPR